MTVESFISFLSKTCSCLWKNLLSSWFTHQICYNCEQMYDTDAKCLSGIGMIKRNCVSFPVTLFFLWIKGRSSGVEEVEIICLQASAGRKKMHLEKLFEWAEKGKCTMFWSSSGWRPDGWRLASSIKHLSVAAHIRHIIRRTADAWAFRVVL